MSLTPRSFIALIESAKGVLGSLDVSECRGGRVGRRGSVKVDRWMEVRVDEVGCSGKGRNWEEVCGSGVGMDG
jgi:hypothetical protein